jgi:AcrR family transcriptional regulator
VSKNLLKTTYHHGDLRQVLLDEAAAILRSEGPAALSMRKLADRAGVSRTAPYHHFEDKQALLCAIGEEGFRRFHRFFHELSLNQSLSREAFESFVKTYVRFAVDNAEYYNLMFGSELWSCAKLTDSLKHEAHEAFQFYLNMVRGWHDDGLTSGTIEPLRFAQVTWSALHGMSRLLIDGIYVEQAAIDAMCTSAANIFWDSLQKL